MYGGGKEYNPKHDLVDRIVDYVTALETILVPENNFVGLSLRERAAALLEKHDDISDISDIRGLLKGFYKVRSTFVHGGDISSVKNDSLKRNLDFETVVREIMVEAIRVIPVEDDRKIFLKQLFDVCDKTRSEMVFNDFCAIKDKDEKIR